MQENSPAPSRLVQIEPLKKSEIRIPVPSNREIYRKKAYIGYRKITGLFYTKHSYGAIRRWVLSKVLPDAVLYRWQPYKRGECNRCGLCCKIVFRCSFFVESDSTTACSIYTSPKHFPSACVAFPIDPLDLAEVQREVAPAPCPFYFQGEPEHPTTWGALMAYYRLELEKRVDKLKEAFDF
jgi:hypothetical protein